MTAAKVDLPDTAWPTGGYYWTVVPVVPVPQFQDVVPLPGATIPVEYRETELPQDVCQSGRVHALRQDDAAGRHHLTPPLRIGPLADGPPHLCAARSTPSFYGTPLVAWESILGAQEYEVQWSKSANPWRPVGALKTPATSSLLPLEPGTWYYRVRGYNYALLEPARRWRGRPRPR